MKSNSKLDAMAGEAMIQEKNTHTDISDGKSASQALWKRPVILLNPAVLREHCSLLATGLNSTHRASNQNQYCKCTPEHNYLQTNISNKIVTDFNWPSKLHSSLADTD